MTYPRLFLIAALTLSVATGATAQVSISENTMKAAEEGAPRPAASSQSSIFAPAPATWPWPTTGRATASSK